MAKVVGNISIKVSPYFDSFYEQTKAFIEKTEARLNKNPIQIRVVPELDETAFIRVRNQAQKALAGLHADVDVSLSKKSMTRARAEAEKALDGITANARVVVNSTTVNRQIGSVKRALSSLDRDGFVAKISAVWKPGTIEPLRDAFYKAMPDLRPWVWPQIDTRYVKTLADGVKNRFSTAWNNGKALRALIDMDINQASVTTAKEKAKVAWDTFKTTVDFDSTRFATQWATYKKMWESGLAGRLKASVYIGNDSFSAVTKSLYGFYKSSGLRSLLRFKIQLSITEAVRSLQTFASIAKKSLNVSMLVSGLSMVGTQLLVLYGGVRDAAKQIAPAAWPAVGIFASIATGAGVTLVALRDAGSQLGALKKPAEELRQTISDTFWSTAKGSILENAHTLIDKLTPSLETLSGVMGDVVGKLADGVGNSVGSLGQIIENSTAGFETLSDSFQRFIEGFLELTGAGSSFFPQFATWIDELSIGFQNWIDNIKQTHGSLENWMSGGVDAASSLWGILSNLVGIFHDVVDMAMGGNVALDETNQRLETIRETLNTHRDGLEEFFAGVRDGSGQVADVIGTVVTRLGTVGQTAGALASSVGGLFASIADTITGAILQDSVMTALDSLVGGVTTVVDSLAGPLQTFATNVADSIGRLGGLLSESAPSLALFADHAGRLASLSFGAIVDLADAVLPGLLDVLNPIVESLGDLAEKYLTQVTTAASDLMPILEPLIAELGTGLVAALDAIIPEMIEFGERVLPVVMDALNSILPIVTALVTGGLHVLAAALSGLGSVAPAVVTLAAGFKAFSVIVPIISPIVTMVSTLGRVFSLLAPVITVVKTAISGLFGVLAANPLGLIVTAIAAVVAGLTWFFTQTETGKQIWQGLMDLLASVWEWIQTTWGTIGEWFSGIWASLQESTVAVWEGIKNAIMTAWNTLTAWFTEVWAVFTGAWSVVWGTITSVATTLWETIKTAVMTAWDTLSGWVTTGITVLSGTWSTIWQTIYDFVSGIWENISTWVSEKFNAVKDTISGVLDTIRGVWETVWGTVKTFVSDKWTQIKTLVSDKINLVRDTVETIMDRIKAKWSKAWENIKEFIPGIWDKIKDAVKTGIDKITGVVETIVEKVKSPFNRAVDAVKKIWNNTIGGFGFDMPDWLGGGSIRIPELADGAVITGPTMAIVGEGVAYSGAQRPEAVLPLHELRPYMANALGDVLASDRSVGGQTYQIHSIDVRLDGDDVRGLRDITAFIDRLGYEARMRGVRG